MKTIAVLGTGNVAHGVALNLKMKGHEVRMFAPDDVIDRIGKVYKTHEIESEGEIVGKVKIDMVTTDIEKALDGADYIIVAVPGNRHEQYARLINGHTTSNQVVLTFNASLSSLIYKNIINDNDSCPVFADTEVPPFSVRLIAPGKIRVYEWHVGGIAFMPVSAAEKYYPEMQAELYPFNQLYSDVLECALSLINPTVHPGPCLVNLGAIEKPNSNFYLYEHGWSPCGLKIDLLLNEERLKVGSALGYTDLCALEDFAGVSNRKLTWEDLYTMGHGSYALTSICGPNDIHYRYLTEDVPIALVCWSSLGKLIGVSTPIMDSVIRLIGVAHDTDWFTEGRTAEKLGLVGMTADEIVALVKEG